MSSSEEPDLTLCMLFEKDQLAAEKLRQAWAERYQVIPTMKKELAAVPLVRPLQAIKWNVEGLTLILGMRRRGKSTLQKDLLFRRRHDIGCVLAFGVEPAFDDLAKRLPKGLWRREYDAKLLEAEIQRRTLLMSPEAASRGPALPDLVVVQDRVCPDTMKDKKGPLAQLVLNGRRLGLGCLVQAQYCRMLPKWVREQVGTVFVSREESENVLRATFAAFFSCVPGLTYEGFQQLVRDYTRDFGWLVVKDGKELFHYKPVLGDVPQEWRLGDPSGVASFCAEFVREHDVPPPRFDLQLPTSWPSEPPGGLLPAENEALVH